VRFVASSFSLLFLACACATSEEVPSVIRDGLDGSATSEGGAVGSGGFGGAAPGSGGAAGLPSAGGAWFNGSGGSSGAATITCGMTQCPDCTTTAFFGTACCKSDGTCGCKAFFGIGNCQ
jgi:hypothetical protein